MSDRPSNLSNSASFVSCASDELDLPRLSLRGCASQLLQDLCQRPSVSGFRILWQDTKDLGSELWWTAWCLADDIRCDKWKLLLACIIVDIIGMMSYLILFIGEVVDFW